MSSHPTDKTLSCGRWPLSVCTWSLRTDPADAAGIIARLGIGQANLALKPAFLNNGKAYMEAVEQQAWQISATTIGFPHEDYTSLESIRATGGIVPDAHWETSRKMVLGATAITAYLGVRFLTLHAGFIEEDDPARARCIRDRLTGLADAAGERGIMLLMETGQETAESLREFLETLNHPALGVNFDPANMILYGKGNPVEAVRALGAWIRHVHVKDACATRVPGTWGTEVPWGQGEVGEHAFLSALDAVGYNGALAIERESGDDRAGDIRMAADRLASFNL